MTIYGFTAVKGQRHEHKQRKKEQGKTLGTNYIHFCTKNCKATGRIVKKDKWEVIPSTSNKISMHVKKKKIGINTESNRLIMNVDTDA